MGAYSRLEQYFFGVGACSRPWGFINFFYLQGGCLNVYINTVPFRSPQKKMNSG